MENPAKLLRRAAQNRRRRTIQPPTAQPVQPAMTAPRHISSHASYSALMRSHDRISTRHIAPRGGA